MHRLSQRNPADLPTSAKLTHLSVYDSRDGVSEHAASPSPPSSLTHVHRDGIERVFFFRVFTDERQGAEEVVVIWSYSVDLV